MNKMWKNDGEEQKLLDKLFREKEVNYTMKPSEVQAKYPSFHGFSAAVFRKHWNGTKIKFISPVTMGNNNGANDDIIEIDGTGPTATKVMKVSQEGPSGNVTFRQQPVVTTVFTDHETKQDVCLVVISLLSKIKRIDFDVTRVDDNHVLKVTFSWPKYAYNCSEMFKREGDNETFVNELHPKFLAVEKALQDVRENMEDVPQGEIEVILPADIQLDPGTWTNYFNKKTDGTLFVFFEFLCVRTDYNIKKREKTIILE